MRLRAETRAAQRPWRRDPTGSRAAPCAPCPQHRAQQRLDALQGPAALQRLVDHWIERALIVEHATHDASEECGLGGQVLRALDLAADPVAFEFRENLVQWRRRNVHLIER